MNENLAERLKDHVYQLSHEIGDRNVFVYDGLLEAERYTEGELTGYGYTVQKQEYAVEVGGREQAVCNLIAEKRGTTKPDEIVILGAHYDNCYIPEGNPGADDNASAVAGMLEVARGLKDAAPERTLRFIAFVNEEPPFFRTPQMGSAVYAREARKRNEQIVATVVFEMIGCFSDEPGSQEYGAVGPMAPILRRIYPTTANFISVLGDRQSREALRRIAELYEAQKPAVPLETNLNVPILGNLLSRMCLSDNLSFWAEDYPAVMVSDTAFVRNPRYHSSADTWDTLNYEKMRGVVEAFCGVVEGMCRVTGDAAR